MTVLEQRVQHREKVPHDGLALEIPEDTAVEIEIQHEVSGVVEVVHLEPETVRGIAVSWMHPLGAHGQSIEVTEGRMNIVEEHVVRLAVGRRTRAGPRVGQEPLRFPHDFRQE